MTPLNFEGALSALKAGKQVKRAEWKNLSAIFLVAGSTFNVNRAPLLGIFPEGAEINYRPHIDGIGADGKVGVWSPSVVDLLAEDWDEVPTIPASSEAAAAPADAVNSAAVDPQPVVHVLTAEDMTGTPSLIEKGYAEGDSVTIAVGESLETIVAKPSAAQA